MNPKPPEMIINRQNTISTALGNHKVGIDAGVKRALIVGAGYIGRKLADELESNGDYQVIGFVDDNDQVELRDKKVLGGRDEVTSLIRQYRIDEVFVAYAPTWQQRIIEDLSQSHPGVHLHIVPSTYDAILLRSKKLKSRGDIAVVELSTEVDHLHEFIKRIFDVVLSLAGLIILAPLMLMITLLVKIASPGPVIFRQERVGKSGKVFILHKFRTMRANAEAVTGPVLSDGALDPRLTPVGRYLRLTRMDEIPQLWNVLKGEMSLVGPRPERPYFVEKYRSFIPSYSIRHRVRPGITGLAQVHGHYHTDARDKLRFDLIYAAQHTLWLDLIILLRTCLVCANIKRH